MEWTIVRTGLLRTLVAKYPIIHFLIKGLWQGYLEIRRRVNGNQSGAEVLTYHLECCACNLTK